MLNESAHSLTRCKKNIHVLEKAGMITRQNAWFANQEPIYLSCTKVMVISKRGCCINENDKLFCLQQEANAKMKPLPQKALLHFTLLSVIIAFRLWIVHRFYLKGFSLILM